MCIIGNSLILVIFVGFYTMNLIFSLFLFVQNRQIVGKTSWMIIFLIFPFIGNVVFATFGQKYKYSVSKEEYFKKETFKYEQFDNKYKNNSDIDYMLEKQSNISKRGVYPANIEMFGKGDEAYEKLFEDLENAQHFIHLQYYIIKPGEIFEKLKEILIRKSNEGIEVRFIVDDFGRWAIPSYEIDFLLENGVRIEKFGKVHFPFIGSYNGYRLHRKMTIIDGCLVHTGGMNIADEYANLNKKYGLWIDYQIKITGKAVRSFSLLFMDDWKHITGEQLEFDKYLKEEETGDSSMVMIEDSPEIIEPVIQDSIINMILNSKKKIILTTPYLVPTPELISALRTAATAGIDIRIIIPGKPDKKAVILATHLFARNLMEYGVKIYEAKNLLIHSKIGIFDDKYAYTGTANLDIRSLYSQWEVIQLITGPAVKEINLVMDNYFKTTKLLNMSDLKTKKIKNKLIRLYVNLFSPIM